MKRKIVAVLTGIMIVTVTGCGGIAGTASNIAAAEAETAAVEEAVTEETAAPEAAADTAAEETAETENTEVAEESEEPAESEEEYNLPEDFLQDQSGKLEFKDYDEIISYLKPGQGYAYVKMTGSDDDLLAIAEQVFEADNTAGEISLYGMRDGKPVFLGIMSGNGSAYPVRLSDGIIYCGDNHRYEAYFLGENGGIMQKDYIDDGVNDGSGKFIGFLRKTNDYDHDEEFTGGQEEFDKLIKERESKPVIVFTMAGDAGSSSSGSLPAYRYPGDDPMMAAVYNYIVDKYAGNYEKSDVSIPYVGDVYTDKSNEDDIQVFGEFWIDNYDLDGDTLKTASGGEYPGVIHIKKDGDTYIVTKVDLVEDGTDWTPSAKKIFGTHYDDFIKIQEDTATRDKVRAKIIKEYADANNLDIKAFQDYGWDPVKLSE